jgi:excisionase family DNA binding protein
MLGCDVLQQFAGGLMKRIGSGIPIMSLTLRQASEASGLSIRKIYQLIGSGQLKSKRIGKRRLILMDSLRQLLYGEKEVA